MSKPDFDVNCKVQPSPQHQQRARGSLARARICELIHRLVALEEINRSNTKREAWARLGIGLRPFPKTIRERCQ
jgi:hypothetical protein